MIVPRFVRCKDATLVRDVLTVGRIYECTGDDGWGNYYVAGKWLSRGRFEPVTSAEYREQVERAG